MISNETLNYRLGTANDTLISFDMFSAGVGRTGTFIALDILTEQGQTLGYVDPVGCVTELRNQRVSMVQTKVVLFQYILCKSTKSQYVVVDLNIRNTICVMRTANK